MKKMTIISFLLLVLIGCANDNKSSQDWSKVNDKQEKPINNNLLQLEIDLKSISKE